MKLISNLFCLVPILALCALGVIASLLHLRRIDNWCARQLTDQ